MSEREQAPLQKIKLQLDAKCVLEHYDEILFRSRVQIEADGGNADFVMTVEDYQILRAALADRPEPAQRQIRHVYGLYPPNTHIQLQVLGCSGTSEYTDIDVQLPCAPQEPAQPVAWRTLIKGKRSQRWLYEEFKPADHWLPLYGEPVAGIPVTEQIQALTDAPSSHPAPSEAGAERQWLEAQANTLRRLINEGVADDPVGALSLQARLDEIEQKLPAKGDAS